MLIGIAGPTGGGKTTIAKMLERDFAAVRMRYSEVLAEIAKERGLDPNDKATLQELYLKERETRGENWLAEEIAARASETKTAVLVIEGNRRRVDIENLCRIAASRGEIMKLIFVDASPDVRFERYNKRLVSEGNQPVTRAEFDKLENNAAEDEIHFLRDTAKETGVYINTDHSNIEEAENIVKKALDNCTDDTEKVCID